MASEFLYHTNCPSCGSRDNLGVYTDHSWCFGCGFYDSDDSYINKAALRKKDNNNNSVDNLGFPTDFDYYIPVEGISWLQQYITPKEIHDNRIGWSKIGKLVRNSIVFAPCMVFPVYDEAGQLLMWQGRYFGTDTSAPKYYTRGAKDCIHLLGSTGPLALTEDLLSAIKVSRVARAVPLWGSSANVELILRLSKMVDDLVIWLDADKEKEARRLAKRASQWFPKVRVVSTPLDPKCYDTEALKGYLYENQI